MRARAKTQMGGSGRQLMLAVGIGLWLASTTLAAQQSPASSGSAAANAWMQAPPTSTGVPVGQKIPDFRLPDQTGKLRDFNSLKGPNGAALYFMRSADW